MAQDSFQEKTEKATPKKREKSREEGQVAKSMELPSVLVVLTGVSTLVVFGGFFYEHLLDLMRSGFFFTSVMEWDLPACLSILHRCYRYFFMILAPVLAVVFIAGLAANFCQVGFAVSWKAIAPRPDKLDAVKGFGRLFSLKSLAELIKSVLKILIIGLTAWYVIHSRMLEVFTLYDLTVSQILAYILKTIFQMFLWTLLVMAAVAAVDYGFQKWQFEKQIMMTRQEIKEEFKEAEGDPQIKSRIRSIQLQAARKRMMQQVPEADVIVTNPTHLALAIRYDPLQMAAPKVLAKGAGRVAEKIKETASRHRIPIVENKELARNLYKLVDIGEEVPTDLYRAVAELLAYVYKLKGRGL